MAGRDPCEVGFPRSVPSAPPDRQVVSDGAVRRRVQAKRFLVVELDDDIHIKGTRNVVVDGDATLHVVGDYVILVEGDKRETILGNLDQIVMGSKTVTVGGDYVEAVARYYDFLGAFNRERLSRRREKRAAAAPANAETRKEADVRLLFARATMCEEAPVIEPSLAAAGEAEPRRVDPESIAPGVVPARLRGRSPKCFFAMFNAFLAEALGAQGLHVGLRGPGDPPGRRSHDRRRVA